jgi:hypothetical protein
VPDSKDSTTTAPWAAVMLRNKEQAATRFRPLGSFDVMDIIGLLGVGLSGDAAPPDPGGGRRLQGFFRSGRECRCRKGYRRSEIRVTTMASQGSFAVHVAKEWFFIPPIRG